MTHADNQSNQESSLMPDLLNHIQNVKNAQIQMINLERILIDEQTQFFKKILAQISNWNPFYNEKAIVLNLKEKFAYAVWFTENQGSRLRFREVPNEYEHIFNYCSQNLDAINQDEIVSVIIPLELFLQINATLNFSVDDKTNYFKSKYKPKFE